MGNIIVIAIIVSIVLAASYKIYAEKKKGAKCVGCPYAAQSNNGSNCGCSH